MERLKELREEKGLSQVELAKLMDIKQRTISHYEKGEREPDFQTLKKLCDFFGVTAGYLLGFEEF
ncbi:MAG: helix-turn-helix domain-containing protein [Firmicutes bacterium]|nr:helix-turn-helix domain-containing protein [Bacillota bacterium]